MALGWVILPSIRVLRVWEAFSSLATLMVFLGPSSVQYRFCPIQSTAIPSTVWIPVEYIDKMNGTEKNERDIWVVHLIYPPSMSRQQKTASFCTHHPSLWCLSQCHQFSGDRWCSWWHQRNRWIQSQCGSPGLLGYLGSQWGWCARHTHLHACPYHGWHQAGLYRTQGRAHALVLRRKNVIYYMQESPTMENAVV